MVVVYVSDAPTPAESTLTSPDRNAAVPVAATIFVGEAAAASLKVKDVAPSSVPSDGSDALTTQSEVERLKAEVESERARADAARDAEVKIKKQHGTYKKTKQREVGTLKDEIRQKTLTLCLPKKRIRMAFCYRIL